MTPVISPAHQRSMSRKITDVIADVFSVFGGPAAWFVALCGGFVLTSQPCMNYGVRSMELGAGLEKTRAAVAILIGSAVLIGLSSLYLAWRAFIRTQFLAQVEERHSVAAGAGRARFFALWGMLLGGGFALATAMTALGFWMLPRCGS